MGAIETASCVVYTRKVVQRCSVRRQVFNSLRVAVRRRPPLLPASECRVCGASQRWQEKAAVPPYIRTPFSTT